MESRCGVLVCSLGLCSDLGPGYGVQVLIPCAGVVVVVVVCGGGGSHTDFRPPPADSRLGPAWLGPPGQRVADRAVTAIIYLNASPPAWSQVGTCGCECIGSSLIASYSGTGADVQRDGW